MSRKQYCEACEIEIKEFMGISGAVRLKSGTYCKDCGESIREKNMKKSGI